MYSTMCYASECVGVGWGSGVCVCVRVHSRGRNQLCCFSVSTSDFRERLPFYIHFYITM